MIIILLYDSIKNIKTVKIDIWYYLITLFLV